MKVIFVRGYQHSGTSIMRRLIGAHPDVYEVSRECVPEDIPTDHTQKAQNAGAGAIVCKAAIIGTWPSLKHIHNQGDLQVNVIRNPIDAFSSLFLRWPGYPIHNAYRQIKVWNAWAKAWMDGSAPGVSIKYEDLFEGGTLTDLQHALGLEPREDIVELMQETKVPINHDSVPEEQPSRNRHEAFRSWQINQPFRNRNGECRKALPAEVWSQLTRLDSFRKLYGDQSSD